jgi:hypothetical protein
MMVTAWVLSGSRPSIPGHVPPPLATIMRECWDADPSQRPALIDIIDILSQSMARLDAGSAVEALGVADSHLTYIPPAPSPHATVASVGSVAVSILPAEADERKVLALSQALEALNVGLSADCLDFARKLTKDGLLSVNQLQDLSEVEAVEVLESCGMKKLQIRTVMKCIALPAAVAAMPLAAAPDPAIAPTLDPPTIASPVDPASADALIAAHETDHTPFDGIPSCVATLQGHGSCVCTVTFHPTAPLLATGSHDKAIKLWRLSSDHSAATCVATLQGHGSSVCTVVFHPTAPLLATGSVDKTIKLWRLSSDHSAATCVATLQGHGSSVCTVAFHPTAPLLATGSYDDSIKLWRLSSDHSAATCVATLQGHSDTVRSVAFHPTAPLLATGSHDKTIKLWRLSFDHSAATCVATLQGHSDSVWSVMFHPTAPLLATGSDDRTIKLWR